MSEKWALLHLTPKHFLKYVLSKITWNFQIYYLANRGIETYFLIPLRPFRGQACEASFSIIGQHNVNRYMTSYTCTAGIHVGNLSSHKLSRLLLKLFEVCSFRGLSSYNSIIIIVFLNWLMFSFTLLESIRWGSKRQIVLYKAHIFDMKHSPGGMTFFLNRYNVYTKWKTAKTGTFIFLRIHNPSIQPEVLGYM